MFPVTPSTSVFTKCNALNLQHFIEEIFQVWLDKSYEYIFFLSIRCVVDLLAKCKKFKTKFLSVL